MEHILTFTVSEFSGSATVGQILCSQAGLTKKQISRAKFYPDGITCNGVQCRVTAPVFPGDLLTVCLERNLSGSSQLAPPPAGLPPLQILYEDPDVLAVHKPAGIVTHPTGSHYHDTLSNQAAWYFRCQKQPVTIRPSGRLDKETSGIVLFAKNKVSASRLSIQRTQGTFFKEYLAVVSGSLSDPFPKTSPFHPPFVSREADFWYRISLPIGPDPENPRKMQTTEEASPKYQPAVTFFRVLQASPQWSLVLLRLSTGRTHQIRVHMKALGHPLLGDTLYGSPAPVPRPFAFSRAALHAWRVHFLQPFSGVPISLEASLPEDFSPIRKTWLPS